MGPRPANSPATVAGLLAGLLGRVVREVVRMPQQEVQAGPPLFARANGPAIDRVRKAVTDLQSRR